MLKNETIHSLITYLQIILITNKLLVSQYLIWHERISVSAKNAQTDPHKKPTILCRHHRPNYIIAKNATTETQK